MRPLSVSLLNINQAKLTIDILEKLANFSGAGWQMQLILVDNGSEADQLEQLWQWFIEHKTQFDEFLFINASKNLGATGGRNTALKLSAHDFILILDNDVILPPELDWLDRLWQQLETDPQVAIVGPMLVFADNPDIVQGAGIALTKTGRVGYLNRTQPVTSVPPNPIEVVASPSACWLVRREAQQQIGLLADEFFPVQYEDVDFCIRLRLAGWKIVCDCGVTIKHIENVTTRNLQEHPFARLTVRQGMRFKEKWRHILPQIATITEDDIRWNLTAEQTSFPLENQKDS